MANRCTLLFECGRTTMLRTVMIIVPVMTAMSTMPIQELQGPMLRSRVLNKHGPIPEGLCCANAAYAGLWQTSNACAGLLVQPSKKSLKN